MILQMIKKFCGGIFFDPKLMLELEGKYTNSILYYLIKTGNKYGIEITKIQFNENSKISIEEGRIEDISEDEELVLSIIDKLKENYVTPIAMNNIIEDMKYEISPRT